MKKMILLSASVFLLSGCATLQRWHQEWLAENCNPTSAYSNGLADGLRPGAMPNNYGNQCPHHQREISEAYLSGFTKGLKSRPQEVRVEQNIHDDRHDRHHRRHRD